MATIGRNAAVTELPNGARFKGVLAWYMWLVPHLAYIVGFRSVSVLVNWIWSYLTYDRHARIIVAGAGAPGSDAGGLGGGVQRAAGGAPAPQIRGPRLGRPILAAPCRGGRRPAAMDARASATPPEGRAGGGAADPAPLAVPLSGRSRWCCAIRRAGSRPGRSPTSCTSPSTP